MHDLFDRLAQKVEGNSVVHTFEALATFAIFSGETFETKCVFVFRLFDFDLSNTLEEQEMVNTLQCVVRAMCKVAGLVIPSVGLLEQLAYVCFQMMDTDKNQHVDFEEFYEWTMQYEELQEFMIAYSGTQTFAYAQQRMARLMEGSEVTYNQWAKQCKSPMVPARQLKGFLNDLYIEIDEKSRDVLFYMIVEYSLRSRHDEDQKDLWAWKLDHRKNE